MCMEGGYECKYVHTCMLTQLLVVTRAYTCSASFGTLNLYCSALEKCLLRESMANCSPLTLLHIDQHPQTIQKLWVYQDVYLPLPWEKTRHTCILSFGTSNLPDGLSHHKIKSSFCCLLACLCGVYVLHVCVNTVAEPESDDGSQNLNSKFQVKYYSTFMWLIVIDCSSSLTHIARVQAMHTGAEHKQGESDPTTQTEGFW